MSAKVSEMQRTRVLRVMLIKKSYRICCAFPQVLQKQTLGEVEN